MNHGSGIYIHYPYCVRKCPYCDFNSRAGASAQGDYAAAVSAELDLRAAAFAGCTFTSIYFGGGTPSLWEPGCVAAVIKRVRGTFGTGGASEVTIEVNPGTASAERLAAYRETGVNRVSIGVQSFDPAVLERLGRIHGAEEGLAAVEAARGAGFDRVGVDLMFGAPAQTHESFARSLKLAAASGIEHVSLYALTVHEETPFGRAGEGALGLPPEEETVAMYEEARRFLGGAGFVHYEIANWAHPGGECLHNLNCWAGGYYLGAGAGAHGHAPCTVDGSVRYANIADPGRYTDSVARGVPPAAFSEQIDRPTRARELIYTGLRMMKGIDLAWLAAEVPREDVARVRAAAPGLALEGLVQFDGRTLRLTDRGELFADRVALALI